MTNDVFPYKLFNGDIYVGDYTEYSKNNPEYAGVGVVYAGEPLQDLNALHIINAREIPVATVNFEDCANLLKDEDGKQVKQCEGMCFAVRARRHGWVLLIELKYCLEKNVGSNVDDAVFQLEQSLNYLRNTKAVIEKKDRVYWVVSVPDHSEIEPFNSFMYSQDDLLELQERSGVVAFFRQNTLEIHTDAHIMVPKI